VTGERHELLDRQAALLAELIRRWRDGRTLAVFAVFVIDLLDPLGFALGNGLHAARPLGPGPEHLIREALGRAPRRRPVLVGALGPIDLADLAARAGPGFQVVAAELRAPVQPALVPFFVRVLVVAGAGAELGLVPVPTAAVIGVT
jgi:hypothetical protein